MGWGQYLTFQKAAARVRREKALEQFNILRIAQSQDKATLESFINAYTQD